MSTTKILLIHGMGEKYEDWAWRPSCELAKLTTHDIIPVHWYTILRGNTYSKIATAFSTVARILVMIVNLPFARYSTLFSEILLDNLYKASLILGYKSIREDAFKLLDFYVTQKDVNYIIIGHSLGSILAYEYLREKQVNNVSLFVSLGSPIDRQPIKGSVKSRTKRLPAFSTKWLNVWGDADPVVCWTPSISGEINSFPVDYQVKATAQRHDLVGYIKHIPKKYL
jgi:pimeloyl-ACP methyl ester carboxylesterase